MADCLPWSRGQREREREKNKMQLESTNKTHCAISLDIKKMERYGLELHQG